MGSVVMVICASAICYGIRGWYIPMWIMLIIAAIVAGTELLRESSQ